MKCPMLTMYALTFEPPQYFKDRDCLEGECGQWDKDKGCCNEVSKTRALLALVDVLTDIRAKMK